MAKIELLTKAQLRNILLKRLTKQTEGKRQLKSKAIEKKLLKLEVFKQAERIMFYLPMDGEVDTVGMINQARNLGKKVFVPVCDTKQNTLIPCVLEKDSILKRGPYQTTEPKLKINFPKEKLDLVIVPGVAFTKLGNRLGRGKGYYDRFLKNLSPKTFTIGLAFDFQILPVLPVSPNDVRLDLVLSA